MASGMRGAKTRAITAEDVEDFMAECSKLLDENRESQPRRSTPIPTPRSPRPDEDDTLHKGTSEIDELRHLLHRQRFEMAELKEELAHRALVTSGVDKVFLGTLTPMEYDGVGDLEDYLSQFKAIARTLRWSEERKGSALYERLKGKALTCVYRNSMAAKAFVVAVVDKQVCKKLREKHSRTINDAVKYAPMIEADKLREELWQEFDWRTKRSPRDPDQTRIELLK